MKLSRSRLQMAARGQFRWSGDSVYRTALLSRGSQVVNISFIGDSITYGIGSTSPDTLGYVALLRTQMQAKYGNGGRGLLPAFRTDWLTYVGAGWGTAVWGIASSIKSNSAAGAGNTMTLVCYGDSVDFYHINNNFLQYTATVDAGTPVSLGGDHPLGEYKNHLSLGTLGNHTVVMTVTGDMYFDAVSVNIGSAGIRLNNLGTIGATIASFFGVSFTKDWEAVLASKLSVVMLTTNDYGTQTALATYQTNLEGQLDLLTPFGSVLMVAAPRPNTSLAIPYSSYVAKAQLVAAEKGAGFIDISAQWGTWIQANARGFMTDALHPTDAGHADIARILSQYLL